MTIIMDIKSKLKGFLTRVGKLNLAQVWAAFLKLFNFCWKSGAIVIGAVMVFALASVLIEKGARRLGLERQFWRDHDLGKSIEVRYFSNNNCATYDCMSDKRISPRLRWVSSVPERDSLTVFCDKEGKRGFLNVNTGEIVIEGQYMHAWHFSEGLAAVVTAEGKLGFINHDNEMVIPAVHPYSLSDEYIFQDGVCVIADPQTGKEGAMDEEGNMKLPMEYDRIYRLYGDNCLYTLKDGKHGLADNELNIIFDTIYDNLTLRTGERQAYLTKDGVKQLVSFDGELLQPFVIDESWPLKYMVKYNDDRADEYALHPYLHKVMVDYRCFGVMDSRNGKMLIPAIYTDIQMISKDLIMAELDGDERHNLIFTTSGTIVK